MGTVLATLLAWCSSALALNPELDISQYAHTSWKIRDGFTKGQITAIAQTPDGYLWLGTEFGLLRFDGVRNVPWQPPADQRLPSNFIYSLLATRDGTLWIGTAKGLASWKDGKLTEYPELAGQYLFELLEDREGTTWASGSAVTGGRLCALRNGSAQCYGEDGALGRGAFSLYEDRKGNLWAGVTDGLWRWKPGSPKFFPLPGEPDGVHVAEDDDGALLVGWKGGVHRFVDGETEALPIPDTVAGFRTTRILHDRNGGLWIGTVERGLVHLYQGRVDVFEPRGGLSGDIVYRLFEDREGSIWVATVNGLDRFRDFAVATLSMNQGLSNDVVGSVLATRDGSVLVGSRRGLNRWSNGRLRTYGIELGMESLFLDTSGQVWVSTNRGIGYLAHDRFTSVSGVPGGNVLAIGEDNAGDLWIVNEEYGLFHLLRGGTEVQQIPWTRFGRNAHATTLAADPSRGGLWLGFHLGGIAYVANGQVRSSYASAEGLGEGRVNNVRLDQNGTLWVATEGGLSRLKDGRIVTLTSKNGLPCDTVHWSIEDDAHTFWLYTACGLIRIARTELETWAVAVDKNKDAGRTIQATVFDSSDGVRILASAGHYSPQVAKTSDGKLWFLPWDGVSVVDPRRIPFNSLPPPVHIEQVIADRKIYAADALAQEDSSLPALTRDLQIDYTALSLVAPEKMRFRYKLEGFDADWQDVGTRRQAFYTNLPPREYRFRVIASNNSGVWNETGASLAFSVAPAYYQTAWFPVLSVAAMLALVWTAHRIRLRIVEKHQDEISALNERLMKAQEQERIRIAGELHDGVMQEMLAATMMVGSAKRRVTTNPADAAATMDKVQQKLVQVGSDIRQLSHDLHPPALQEAGLPEAMRSYCEEFSASSGIAVSCDADDSAHDLSRGAALALFRIVQEALGNAAKHAAAKQIIVRLIRANGNVSLTVSDDGVGFDRSQLGTSGGLGLIMMRERASQLNGKFEFESAPGRGATTTVTIPFR